MSSVSKASDESEPLLTKLKLAFAGVALTIIGAMVSTWFSDRSWTWQAYVTKIDKENEQASGQEKDEAQVEALSQRSPWALADFRCGRRRDVALATRTAITGRLAQSSYRHAWATRLAAA